MENGNNFQLWDADTGDLKVQGGAGVLGEFSPDGKNLARTTIDVIEVWDTSQKYQGKMRRKRKIGILPDTVFAVAWSPNSRYLAGSGDFSRDADSGHFLENSETSIRLWNTQTWKLHATLKCSEVMRELKFSPDNRYLASKQYNAVTLWDLSTRRKLWQRSSALENEIDISPDSKILAASQEKAKKIALWKIPEGKVSQVLTSPRGTFISFAFAPDGNSILTGNSFGEVHRWRLK
jgi:WD40 repeat protein